MDLQQGAGREQQGPAPTWGTALTHGFGESPPKYPPVGQVWSLCAPINQLPLSTLVFEKRVKKAERAE